MPNRYRIEIITHPVDPDLILGATQGVYSLTGQDLFVRSRLLMEPVTGFYDHSGEDITMFKQGALLAETGVYDYEGEDGQLTKNRLAIAGDQGDYSLTGQDATLTELSEPLILQTSTQQFPTLRSSFTLDLTPFDLEEGDLLIAIVVAGKNSGLLTTLPGSWFAWHNNLTPSNNRFSIALKNTTGSETEAVFSFSTDVTGCAIVYHIRAWDGNLGNIVGSGIAEGTNSTPDPPLLDPPWSVNNTLWLPMVMADLSTEINDSPGGFSNLTTVTSGAGNTNSIGVAQRVEAVDSIDPDFFALASPQFWQTVHMGISQVTPAVIEPETGVYGLTGINAGLFPPSTGSRAGDEQALEDLYVAANGGSWNNNAGWGSSGMNLSNTIFGVTTATIDGELRVTELNLRSNNLTGSINTPTLSNLTELRLFAVYYNNLDTQFPAGLMQLLRLRYCYLSFTGNVESEMGSRHPHEWIADDGENQELHTGKEKGDENNVITGTIPAPSNPSAMSLEWFICDWTDTSESVEDGIQEIERGFFDIDTFVTLYIYENRGIADLAWPDAIKNMHNLYMLALGGSHSDTGFLTGSMPGNLENLTQLRYLYLARHGSNFTIDFDVTDFRQFDLRLFIASFTDVRGTFPPYMTDGSQQDLVFLILSWPQGPGMDGTVTGPVSEDDESLQGCMLTGHDLDQIDPKFWNHIDLINQNFAFNEKLTTIGTDDLTHMSTQFWKLRNLRWYNCSVKGRWPNLAWGTDQVEDLTRFQVYNNQYNFEDILWRPSTFNPSNKTIYQLYVDHGNSIGGWLEFQVSGHEGRGGNHAYSLNSGDNITLDDFDSEFTHSGNNYQWEKDGSNISGATNRSLTLTNVDAGDAGAYQLKITNSGAPQVGTVRSGIITIEVD